MAGRKLALATYAMRGGGMETTLLRLGAELRRRGWDARIVTTEEPGDWFDRCADAGVPAEHVAGHGAELPANPVVHATRVGRYLARFDVVLLSHAAYAQASLGLLPDRVIAIPVLHNDMGVIYDVGCANTDAVHAVVAVSPKVEQIACERLGPGRVRRIQYGVDSPPAAADRSPSGPSFEVVFAGRLWHPQKGSLFLPAIIAAARERGSDVRLTILGDGPDRAALEREVEERGLAPFIRFRGMVAPSEALATFATADALLLPSFFEGLPLTLLEAQAAGCVPVASRLPGMTDVSVEHGTSGLLVEPGDVEGFGAALDELARDRARWRSMSRASYATIREDFSTAAMATQYETLIEECRRGTIRLPRSRRLAPPFVPTLFSWKDYLPPTLRSAGKRVRDRLRG